MSKPFLTAALLALALSGCAAEVPQSSLPVIIAVNSQPLSVQSRQALAQDARQACLDDDRLTGRLHGNAIRFCGCYEEETAHLIKVFDNDANRVAEALKVAYARCSTDRSVWHR
jgi:hypothetical protein